MVARACNSKSHQTIFKEKIPTDPKRLAKSLLHLKYLKQANCRKKNRGLKL